MIDHISVSQVRKFQTCPKSWELQYLDKVPQKASARMALGIAVHRALAVANGFRQRGHTVANPEQPILNTILNEMEQEAKGITEGDKEVIWDDLKDFNDLMDRATKVTKRALAGIESHTGHPMLIEQSLERIALPDTGIKLVGYVDLVDSEGKVYDFKVGKRKHNQPDVDGDLQLSVYCHTVGAHEAAIVDVNSKTGEVSTVQTRRTKRQCENAIKELDETTKAMQSGVYPPKTEGWHCSASYCGVWEHCPFGGKR